MEGKVRKQTNMDWVQYFFTDKYHDVKLTKNLSARQTGHHSANSVIPTRDICSALDNLEMSATADQSHVDQLMKKIYLLTDTNNILGTRSNNRPKQTQYWISKFKKI